MKPIKASGCKGLVSQDHYSRHDLDFDVPQATKGHIKLTEQDQCTMKDLNYQLKQLCRNNRDGSYATQALRSRMLDQMADQLHELGFRKMQAKSLKPKHVVALTRLWERQGLSTGTRKNRMSTLRWWAGKVNKKHVVARDNEHYGLARRQYVSNASRVTTLNNEQIESIRDPNTRLSLKLQQAFGLRREEAIKFQPSCAIKDDHLQLKSSWCKGGRARTIPIANDAQRELLKEVQAFAKGGSLIPPDLKYVQQLRRYEGQTRRAGLRKLHGLRHGYAQRRFQEITGFACPAQGGPVSRDLTPDQRALNEKARAVISAELGHARENITAVYLGR